MRRDKQRMVIPFILFVLAALCSMACGRPEVRVTVPAGTDIQVELADAIGSAQNGNGDTFSASIVAPIDVNGEEIVPAGTNVAGRVTSARPSGHLETPAELAVTLTAIEIGGRQYEIHTVDRTWVHDSHTKGNVAWIGGAAGAGAVIGALVGHGKGAAIGAGVGAGSGTAAAYATGQHDVVLPPRTRLTFVLREPVTLRKATETDSPMR